MKFLLHITIILFLASCSVVKQKTMNSINMEFGPLPAIPSGDYESEVTLLFRRNMVKDKEILKNFKQADFANKIQPIYVNTNQNTFFGRLRVLLLKLGSNKSGFKLAVDPTYNLALYNLAEQYPEVDYWTNIRVERTVQGRERIIIKLLNRFLAVKRNAYIKTGPETVKIKATGVNIMTDSEFEEYKKSGNYNELDYGIR